MKIVNVVGTRPNFIKIAPISRAFERAKVQHPEIEILLVHTGQHYDDNMSKIFFDELDIPAPDVNLEIGPGAPDEQKAKIMSRFEEFCLKEKPTLIIVIGDVTSTLACSKVAAKLDIPLAHVEAGIRSMDSSMPEERNRIEIDALSSYLFTPSTDSHEYLEKEGIIKEKIFFVGNVMIDTLHHCLPKAERSTIMKDLQIEHESYAFVTVHRPSNVDNEESLNNILKGLEKISKKIKVIFTVHPRTRVRLEKLEIYDQLKNARNFKFIDPIGYLDCLHLMQYAKLVITDSGGMQEETTVLGVPCLTFRDNTERPVTVTEGTNILVGTDMDKLLSETDKILNGQAKKGKIPELWDGKTAERIVEVIINKKKDKK